MQKVSPLRNTTVLLLSITLLGFAVRVINLGGDSLWADEIFTVNDSRQSVGQIVVGNEIDHPLGYFLLQHFAFDVWGTSDYALRLLSAFAGVATIPLVYVMGSQLANRRVGLWAAGLLAVAPFHIRYSQEARGYALQVALLSASTACLLLALKRRQYRWWIGFGIATALSVYILYSSFVIFASQLIFVGLLLLTLLLLKRQTIRQVLQVAVGLLVGVLTAAMLYSPWLGQAVRGATANIGPAQGYLAMWVGVPLGDWVSAGYVAFGFMQPALAALTGLLALLGCVRAAIRRRIDQTLWLLTGLFFPLLLITALDVSRAPLPKYILFVMIVYLVATAIGLDTLIQFLTQRVATHSVSVARSIPVIAAIGLMGVSVPLIQAEHAYVYNDWKGIAQYLENSAHAGDAVIPMTLDLADSFNQGHVGLSYYLPHMAPGLHLLMGEHLTDPSVSDLPAVAQASGDVWFILLNRNQPIRFDDPNIEVIPFQADIYLVHAGHSNRPPLEEMAALYPKIIPQAVTSAAQCYLWFDLATLHVRLGQFDEAYADTARTPKPCPDSLGIRRAIYQQLVEHYRQAQQTDHAREIALKILALDAKDKLAWTVLTFEDLSNLFQRGAPSVSTQPSPARPIDVQRFTMPQNGDWDDALVMQTPAQIAFRLDLPPEPVEFVSRIAMSPESWNWGGDGAQFSVRLMDAAGRETIAFDQSVSNQAADRHWHAVAVPLRQYAGQTITLTLETDPGPRGDTTGDWAGWGTPRIIYAGAQ
jgi:hypothetical protein